MSNIVERLAAELGKKEEHVQNIVTLLDEGNTVPFIARYRKEMHGAMDDQTIRLLAERLQYLRNLEARKEEVKTAIDGQGKLTEELALAIENAETLAAVEDLYRPYKQKRRTRATAAREKGLEPLAALLFAQDPGCPDPLVAAADFIDPEKGVNSAEEALQGANDIVAEDLSDDPAVRGRMREFWLARGDVRSSAAKKDTADSVYRNYYNFTAAVGKIAGHQVLAVDRGEREGFLKVSVEVERENALALIERLALKRPACAATPFVKAAIADSYDRLIAPSVEREVRAILTEKACEGAIGQFALNLRPLLMQPPVK